MKLLGNVVSGTQIEVSAFLSEAKIRCAEVEHQLSAFNGSVHVPDIFQSKLDAAYRLRLITRVANLLMGRILARQALPLETPPLVLPAIQVVQDDKIIPDHLLFNIGDAIKLPYSIQPFRVLEGPFSGGKGVVYKVENLYGPYCIKFAQDHPKARTELAGEVQRDEELRNLGFRSARIYWSDEKTVLKDWIFGRSAWSWYEKWDATDLDNPWIKAVFNIIDLSILKKLYVDGLNPDNLIFSRGDWVIVDAKPFVRDLTREAVIEHYVKYIEYRWGGVLHEKILEHYA